MVVGDGAAQLLSSAAYALMDEPLDELVTPWPSYGLYPVMAHRARAHAVPVPGYGVDAVLSAVNEHTRVVALCSPNDPTGELVAADELRRLLEALPERVVVLLDEALADFADAQPLDASLALLEDFPRLLCFRSFSKAWGLAGLRVGYALGGPGSEPLLEQLAPELGVNELAQAGALEALRSTEQLVQRRVERVRGERARLLTELRSASASRSRPARRTSSGWRPTGSTAPSSSGASTAPACASPAAARSAIPEAHPRLDPRRRCHRPLPARARRRAGLSSSLATHARRKREPARGGGGARPGGRLGSRAWSRWLSTRKWRRNLMRSTARVT